MSEKSLEESLKDPDTVHVNILRGTIALTKEQAIHIAGLPADIENRVAELSKPVTDEEWNSLNLFRGLNATYAHRKQVDALLARRVERLKS